MKNLIKPVAYLTLVSFLCSSCGVMFGGSKFIGTVTVKDHPKAEIFVNGTKAGQGTSTGLYHRNTPLTVEVRQDGCDPKTQVYGNTFRTGNFILSLVSWGLVGALIDLGTGASFKPDHRGNTAIQKVDDKNFTFTVDYSGCPK